MPRDEGLEILIEDALEGIPGITRKAMFGGMAWMLRGNLLFGARKGSILIRLGKGNDAWALATEGITPMLMNDTRSMPGWVRALPPAYSNDKLRNKLFQAALNFNGTLPSKPVKPRKLPGTP
jgi:hypothetical protein